MPALLLHFSWLLAGLGTLALPSIHRRDGDRGNRRREDLGRTHGRRLQRGSLGDQEDLNGFAEVLHEMKAIDDLHRVGGPLANAVRIEGAPIPTDHGDRGMLGQPGRDAGGRTVRQEVDDAMCRQINEDGAVPMSSPPGPLIDIHRL
jgi:hypothetical protein